MARPERLERTGWLEVRYRLAGDRFRGGVRSLRRVVLGGVRSLRKDDCDRGANLFQIEGCVDEIGFVWLYG